MQRNFSAKSTGLRLQPRVNPNLGTSDSEKVFQLKNRLFERGLSSKPLPSVKKPKVSQSVQKLASVPTLSSLPEQKLSLRPFSTRTSATGFTSVGALRPSSALKIIKAPASITTRTANQPARPETARSNLTNIGKINSSRTNIQVIDTERAASLIEKLTNRPKTAKKENPATLIPEIVEIFEKDQNFEEYFGEDTKIDLFIKAIKEGNIEENEFIYLVRCAIGENSDYRVVSAEEARREENEYFYTLSAKGLSTFNNGTPTEFMRLSDFLIERRHFFNMQHVSFFKQFRVWKTVKMWLRNVNRIRRERRKKKLEDRLYAADPAYTSVLLKHRSMCLDIEKMKFIEVPGYIDQLTLEEFKVRQQARIKEVRDYITENLKSLRENVNQGVVSIMNQLREDIVMDIAEEKNYGKINLQMFPHARKICALYEKMGFPENMSYGQRSVLRKECSRYIKFTYLVDFIALESLQNLYLSSVRELLLKIYEQINEIDNKDAEKSDLSIINQAETKKRNKVPLFKINFKLNIQEVSEEFKMPLKSEFVPRKTPAEEFHPNIHLSFDGENEVSKAFTVKGLEKMWLRLWPNPETFIRALEGLVNEGLNCIKLIERWSKHPDMNDYVSALEDWDDKVADKWQIPETLELDIVSWIEDYPLYRDIRRKLASLMKKAFKKCKDHYKIFEYPVACYWKNTEIDFKLLQKENLLQKVDAFDWTFAMFKAQRALLEKSPKFIDSGLFRIDCTEIRNFFISNSKDSLKKSQEILLKLIRENIEKCRVWASKSVRLLGSKVFTVEEFVEQKVCLSEVNEKISEVKRSLDLLSYLYNLGHKAEIGLSAEDNDIFQTTAMLMSTLNGYIINIESTNTKNMQVYKKKLKAMVPDFLQDVQAMLFKISEEKYLRLESDQDIIIQDLKEMQAKCENFQKTSVSLARFQEVLLEPIGTFQEVQSLCEQVEVRHRLWQSIKEYENSYKLLLYSSVKQINPSKAVTQAEEYLKVVRRSENVLPESAVLNKLKVMVEEIIETMPVITALRAPLTETHWKMLKEILGESFEVPDSMTLISLLKYPIKENSEKIQAIGIQASQEFELKAQLKAIITEWEEMEIPLKQYKEKDSKIIGDIEDLALNLDESLAKVNLIAGNRYVAPLRDEVFLWRGYLNSIQEVLDEWTSLQKTWIYFNAIFVSQDIKRRLATETQIFESVDKFYRTLMKRVNLNNNVLKVMVLEGKLLDHLKKHNNSLDVIQRNLSQYLEDKRMIFPRFYFISDDELLKILAQAGSPLLLQPYFSKCFENIYRLEFGEDIKAADIVAMVSAEGESVHFGGRVLKARGNVEEWLGNVESIMVDTLMKFMKYCKEDAEKMNFKAWVMSAYPAQVIAVVSQINWCIETDVTLASIHDSPSTLSDWMHSSNGSLLSLIDLVRGSIPELKRKLIVALITTSVHNRDILTSLNDLEVESNSDFGWQQQLRYYWDNDVCIVKQINYSTSYAYEYLGCTSRLVVTPLTEKCWITITSALNIKLGASPSGPAGTGKTESTKDLAKALGQYCVVVNCSEQITYKAMGKVFSGLVQQGAWACLDEFNRIDIEVLSVIAQQLQTIKHAQTSLLTDFWFEGRKIVPKSGFGVFVTMNPGYAGRTELPDNLKVLFRPVAMMIPDYALISEIILLAEGFKEGNRLSKKTVQLYKLASQQLSLQPHYDFGMRALKAVLSMAGELRRKMEGDSDEELILIQAMNNSNIPKLVAEDVILFKALVNDLFPGVKLPEVDRSKALGLILKIVENLKLQFTPSLEKKIFELEDTLRIRFGVMLVGPPMSGKSSILRILGILKSITMHSLNPKAVSIGELYGDMNPLTQDWKDGLASSILREITALPNPEQQWVVFDGPVDSLWIESMNTVLDDNMMLYLANGERIKLKPAMRLLFEVMDLHKASPATVSRCGMVYVPSETLQWGSIAHAWLSTLDHKEIRESLLNLFNNILPPLFKSYDRSTDMVLTSEVHKVQSLCNLLSILLHRKSVKAKHVPALFSFAVIWSVGAFLDSSKYERSSPFPIPDTVYDYYLDDSNTFKSWKDLIPSVTIPKGTSLSQILIPTSYTTTYVHLLSLFSIENKSVLLVGSSGVGKSAIVSMHLNNLFKQQEIELVHSNFSARTTSQKTQSAIEAKLERTASGVFSGTSHRKLCIFIDDVNMPAKDLFETQPPIELLRQLLDKNGFYDRKKVVFKKIDNFLMICIAGNRGVKDLTPRFTRHFQVLYVAEPSHAIMSSIFATILSFHFEKTFAESVRKSIPVIIAASIELYEKIITKLKPTPLKFHYQYNLRDVGKVVQGMTMSNPFTLPSLDKLTKLWLHETSRVFHDRLISQSERTWFNTLASNTAIKHFKSHFLSEDWLETHPVLFTNIQSVDTVGNYEEITDKKRLRRFVQDRLEDFNVSNRQKMNLEIFEQALEHILRICRGVFKPRGNVMVIGVGGSGKQSLSSLCAFLLSHQIFQIQIVKNYGIDNFHEDLKKLLNITTVQNKLVSFIFTDQHIIQESFLEDINSLINTGEISDLFTEEELETIFNALRPEVVEKLKLVDTKENIYAEFIRRIRDNLHVIICASPIGSSLRNRCKMFPALINCSTLDWFEDWPEEALVSVGSSKLSVLNLQGKNFPNLASSIHLSSTLISSRFYQEFKRVAYVTPKLFFDFLDLFAIILNKTNVSVLGRKKKLESGLQKLHETRKLITELQAKLQQMIPDLEIEKNKAENYYQEVQKETSAAVDLQSLVEKETDFIEMQALECKLKAEDAEKDLAEAMPILETAIKAVQALEKNKKDIIEFKRYLKPPDAVKMVMEAVCILLNERTDWTNAISILGQMDFLQKLINYNKESVTSSIFKKLRGLITKPEFQPEIVAQSSEAAKSLCIWCIAIYKFTEAYQVVKPRREKVAAMQVKLKSDMEKLENKQLELRYVEENVNHLKDECALTEAKVADLEKNIKITGERVKRAELLLDLLAEEGVKWKETLEKIEGSLKYIESEAMLNAACIAYLGVYSVTYRSALKSEWLELVKSQNFCVSEEYSFVTSLGKPLDIRAWQIAGLPKDSTSIESSVIVVNALKWNILIDPQDQARKWVKNMDKAKGIISVKASKIGGKEAKEVLRTFEFAVTQGKPVVIEDASESLDSSISNILNKKTYKKEDGRTVIKVNDHEISYDDNFCVYILCRIANPNFLPDIFGNLNVVNFTVTEPGLEDQLLIEVVKLENPRLEKERDDIIVSLANDQKLLIDTQNSILDMIADSQGYILDNVALITALQRSKNTSKDISRRVSSTVTVEETINVSRELFREIAVRGTVLYFVISEIPGINPMYQYSLAFITKIFCNAIQNTKEKNERLANIIENVTKEIFNVVCRGLFEKDKKLFAFLFATAINKNKGLISNADWNLFIRGGGLVNKKNNVKNPMIGKISEGQWDFLCKLDLKVQNLKGIAEDICLNIGAWNDYITGDVLSAHLPNKFNLVDEFTKLLIIKALRPEKIMYAIDIYVLRTLGKYFSEVSLPSLEHLFEESDKKTPILFVLSQGSDPIEDILKVCRDKGTIEKLSTVSLGQGQGTKAQDLFEKSKSQGTWLLLQNCHLSKSWLPSLEVLIDNLQDDSTAHRDFRIILTSMPETYFPVSILQNSSKITTEPPSGIKANLFKIYTDPNNLTLNDSNRPDIWKKMVFSISFFHALVMERRKFGPLGFNIKYEFNDSDFQTSIKLMKLLLEENEEIPWDGIQYIIGNINYGGRVTDLNDRICLLSIFNKCCNPDIFEEGFFYSENEVYKIPFDDEVSYIQSLPLFDLPEIFGMNVNAQFTLEETTSEALIHCLLQTQPKEISSEAADSDKTVHGISKSLSIALPEPMDLKAAHNDLLSPDKNGVLPSLSIFLFQEIEKFNRLLEVTAFTLKELRNAIKGKVTMTDELTEIYASLLNSKLPKSWQDVSYPSLKPLGSWINDLIARVKFMFDWLKYGSQNCFWMSAFFFPQSFLTAVLQSYSRKYSTPIDNLVFTYEVTQWNFKEFKKIERDGVHVYGLYLEGARWDKSEGILADAIEKEIYAEMPVIWFLPTRDYIAKEGDFQCPLYKTTKRAGVLNSTGLSTNFVVYVDLPSEEISDKWTLLGTALLCQINN